MLGLNPRPTSIEAVYPETLFIPIAPKGVGLLTKAESALGSAIGKAESYFLKETVGLKQWIRFGPSYSVEGGFKTYGVRWGAGAKFWKKIGNPTLRQWNRQFRQTKLPFGGWRSADPGHFHFWKK
jgi:hypothetical protein